MKLTLTILALLLGSGAFAQLPIGPYNLGQYSVDTVFEFTYVTGEACPVPYVATINTNGLYPFISGMDLELLVKDPAVINSISYPANTIVPLIQGGQDIEVEFYSIEWSYCIIASGTATVPEENIPCWFEDFHQTGFCEDSVSFQWGESLVPCTVQPSVGINETVSSPIFNLKGKTLSFHPNQKGIISIFTLDGKKVISLYVASITSEIELSTLPIGTYVAQFVGGNNTVSEIFILQ